ncbi:signal-regulatory protein beta-1-like [Varanus komodoensis]|uniref:signal-regulatory protein beta-1-like n=1 Tax=Varanus komodoensis TaxID=61221 RepID=UPI001CF7A329|nr:signal-regulatory protein beta-1-like [Varanus komodoensis]
MAFGGYFWSLCLSLLLSPSLRRAAGQELTVVQPQDVVEVRAGATLILGCSVTGATLPGPVKWFLGEGPARKLIYAEIGWFERVLRTNKDSDTDFSIVIRNVTSEDAGTYYCVKQKKGIGDDKDVKTGPGTRVVMKDARDVFIVTAVAVATSLLLFAALLFTVAYIWAKKKRDRKTPFPSTELPLIRSRLIKRSSMPT